MWEKICHFPYLCKPFSPSFHNLTIFPSSAFDEVCFTEIVNYQNGKFLSSLHWPIFRLVRLTGGDVQIDRGVVVQNTQQLSGLPLEVRVLRDA